MGSQLQIEGGSRKISTSFFVLAKGAENSGSRISSVEEKGKKASTSAEVVNSGKEEETPEKNNDERKRESARSGLWSTRYRADCRT